MPNYSVSLQSRAVAMIYQAFATASRSFATYNQCVKAISETNVTIDVSL